MPSVSVVITTYDRRQDLATVVAAAASDPTRGRWWSWWTAVTTGRTSCWRSSRPTSRGSGRCGGRTAARQRPGPPGWTRHRRGGAPARRRRPGRTRPGRGARPGARRTYRPGRRRVSGDGAARGPGAGRRDDFAVRGGLRTGLRPVRAGPVDRAAVPVGGQSVDPSVRRVAGRPLLGYPAQPPQRPGLRVALCPGRPHRAVRPHVDRPAPAHPRYRHLRPAGVAGRPGPPAAGGAVPDLLPDSDPRAGLAAAVRLLVTVAAAPGAHRAVRPVLSAGLRLAGSARWWRVETGLARLLRQVELLGGHRSGRPGPPG